MKDIYMAYYAENTQDYPCLEYSLVDENCAALVNTILERLGFSKDKREEIGEFTGIDWGEEDLLPSKYFARSLGQYVPDGSFRGSSCNITVHVSANCKKADGNPQWSLLDLTFLGNVKLKNTNGNLEYDGVQASSGYVPGGSYKDSCDNIKVTLRATCQKADGTWQESAADLEGLTNAKFTNMNGVLTKEAG